MKYALFIQNSDFTLFINAFSFSGFSSASEMTFWLKNINIQYINVSNILFIYKILQINKKRYFEFCEIKPQNNVMFGNTKCTTCVGNFSNIVRIGRSNWR